MFNWRTLSLLSGAIGLLVFAGLIVAFVQEYQRGGTYGDLLGWAVLVIVLLVVAYFARHHA